MESHSEREIFCHSYGTNQATQYVSDLPYNTKLEQASRPKMLADVISLPGSSRVIQYLSLD